MISNDFLTTGIAREFVTHTDFMIDDHCKNLDSSKGKPLMFSSIHNVNYMHYLRVNNWPEVLNFFANQLTSA